MTVEITPVLRHGWQGQAPSITDDEIRILLPIVQGGGSPVARLLRAYRLGVAVHDPITQPLAGSQGCPICEGVAVTSIVWTTSDEGHALMWHRCGDCDAVFNPPTGEVWAGPAPEVPRG
jgi:hypothetical protein